VLKLGGCCAASFYLFEVEQLTSFVYGNEPWPSTPVPERICNLRHPETGNPRLVECAERDYAALEAKLGGRRSDVLEQ
jgi:hypothetical protein